jgi:hypothetical protein
MTCELPLRTVSLDAVVRGFENTIFTEIVQRCVPLVNVTEKMWTVRAESTSCNLL